MTATISHLVPMPSGAQRPELLAAGAKRIMGVAKNKGCDSVEVFELVIRWGRYIDQADHKPTTCRNCTLQLVWNSFDLNYVHAGSGHKHCSTHAGRTASPQEK